MDHNQCLYRTTAKLIGTRSEDNSHSKILNKPFRNKKTPFHVNQTFLRLKIEDFSK